jgi:hypothetical protein
MIIKSTLLAVTLFLGSINLAEAQLYVTGGVPGPGDRSWLELWLYRLLSDIYRWCKHHLLCFFPGWRLWIYK